MDLNETFLKVIEDHRGILYKIVRSYCKSEEDRKDLIQEIIFQLWESFKKYDNHYKYSTWIYRIALNISISFYRKNRTLQTSSLPLEENIFTFQEIEIDKEKENQINQLQIFIDELKDIDKAIMLLYLEEKSHKEISEIIGTSETNVGTKINRIKKILLVKFQNSK